MSPSDVDGNLHIRGRNKRPVVSRGYATRQRARWRWTVTCRLCCSLIACLTILLGCAAQAGAQVPALPSGVQPSQWRLVWTEDPSTAALISWSTKDAGGQHKVHFATKGNLDRPQIAVCQRNGRYTDQSGDEQLYYHHARLTELEPGTAYEVQLVSDGKTSPVFYFVTAPADDRSFSFLFGGDSRSDQATRRAVNRQIARMVAAGEASEDPADEILAFVHGGDYIVSGRSLPQWSRWMSDHQLTTTEKGRLLPIIPARGNHDRGQAFNEVFGFPADDLNYYALDVGPQLRIVTLNTETTTSGDQAKWLADELSKSRSTHRWIIAQYHRPAFPAVKSPSRALQSWVPLFEKFNVDLVCEADGHNIKRTVPVRNGRRDETGVVYIGEGGLGVRQRTPKKDRWYLQDPGMADRGHHVQLLTFTPKELQYRCVLLGGRVLDRYVLVPRK